jgi:DNA repair protein RadC
MRKYPAPSPALRIKDLGADDQPREKLLTHGARSLSDAEVVAILLGSGIPGASALEVARRLLLSVDHNLHDLAKREVIDLRRFAGIGRVRAIRLVAALELGRRREAAAIREKPELGNSEQSFRYLRPLIGDLAHEEFHLLCLNRANRLLGSHLVSRGGVTGTVADARTIFRAALSHGSVTSLVLAHNHPSGQAFPSQADIVLTRKLAAGARQLDLYVLDHIIVAGERYYSFADDGALYPAAEEV